MRSISFPLPKEIAALVAKGIWPYTTEEFEKQETDPIVSRNVIQKIAPEESGFCLYMPHTFRTVASEIEYEDSIWHEFEALDQIEPEKCLIIGDFGLGSDTAIVLDYSIDPNNPIVKRLVWASEGNYWETVADTFREFLVKLGLLKDS